MIRRYVSSPAALTAIMVLLSLAILPTCDAQNHEQQYLLQDDGSTHALTLSVTPALYEYYQQKSHQLTLDNFASFVTPYSMAPVAEDIRSAFPEEEDFVNAVLMLVHQISYKIVNDGKYPVETIMSREGDCDLLSFVSASLTKAQGLDTVLFYYEQESHMNVGVNLSQPPSDARSAITYVDDGGTRYYMAECTGGEDWQNGWRVGECPPELEDAQLSIGTLEGCEQIAPGQVSSSFSSLDSSAVSLAVSSSVVIEGDSVLVSGQVFVSNPNGTVTLYVATTDDWSLLGEAIPDSVGHFTFSWKPTVSGQHQLRASWAGDEEHMGTDSRTVSVYVIPKLLVFALGSLVTVVTMIVLLFLIYRTTHGHNAPNIAEVPSSQAQQ